MYWYLKILSLNFLLISAIFATQVSSLLTSWVLLELGTLSYIFYLTMDSTFLESFQEIMKMFLIQALSGVMLLMLFVIQELDFSNSIMMIYLVMLLKMGGAPFHSWLMSMSLKLSWSSLYIFLTVQKIIPLQILSYSSQSNSSFIAILGFLISGYLSFFLSNLKQLVVVSSLFFLSMLFLTFSQNFIWFELLIIYSTIFFPLGAYFWTNNQQVSFLNFPLNSNINNGILFLFLASLSGLPPTPGFFMKYLWFLSIEMEFFILILFLIISGLMTYLYLSFSLNSISNKSYYFSILNISSNFSIFTIFPTLFFSFLISFLCFFY